MEQQKRKKLFLMSGVAGVGKSTFILNHISEFSGLTKIVSRDAIRFQLIDNKKDYFSKEKEVWFTFIKDIKDGLENEWIDNLIVDATHLTPKSRKKLFNAIGMNKLINVDVNAICLVASLDYILANNKEREGLAFVPETAIRNMYNTYVIPSYEEGFHHILIVNSEKERDICEKFIKEN